MSKGKTGLTRGTDTLGKSMRVGEMRNKLGGKGEWRLIKEQK